MESIDPDTVQVDARRFQFKAGGDEAGVSERLQGIEQWDPLLAGVVIVWEDRAGNRFIADGHQRLALAKRLKAEGKAGDVRLNAHVLREADGISDREAMARAAATNIAQGTGTAIDAAKVLRLAAKEKIDLPPLPPRSALARDAAALARLSDEAFGMAVNEVVPAHYAAIVGRLVDDPLLQVEALRLIAKAKPENAGQAEFIVRELLATGAELRTQGTLFGDEAFAASVVVERAQVLDEALKRVKRDKAAFAMLVKEGERLAEAGNVLASAANIERLSADEQVLEVLTRLATRKGPVSDALTAAARRYQAGEVGRGEAARAFLVAVKAADLEGLERGAVAGEPVAGGAGGAGEAARAAGGEPGAEAEGLAPEVDQTPGTGPGAGQQTLFQRAPGLDLDQRVAVVRVPAGQHASARDARAAAAAAGKARAPVEIVHPAFPQPLYISRRDWAHAVASFSKSIQVLGDPAAALVHADAMHLLPELAAKAVLVIERPALKAEADVAKIYRLFAAMRHGDDLYAVKLTVKQFRSGGAALSVDGVEKLYKLYDARLEKRVPAAGSAQGEPTAGASSPTYPKTAPPEGAASIGLGDTIILRDLLHGIKGDDGEFLAQVVGGEPRAAIELADGLARLWLGPLADPSSPLHEHGHMFLGLLRDVARDPEADDAARRDWGTVRDWLGATDPRDEPGGRLAPLTPEQHEQWAQAFERYVAEGKAPSLELASVFERFKSWLLDIYRSVRDIAPEIPPELRAVMDRLLATEEQIATARMGGAEPAPGPVPGAAAAALPEPPAWTGSRLRALRLLRIQKPLPLRAPRQSVSETWSFSATFCTESRGMMASFSPRLSAASLGPRSSWRTGWRTGWRGYGWAQGRRHLADPRVRPRLRRVAALSGAARPGDRRRGARLGDHPRRAELYREVTLLCISERSSARPAPS